jgi:hypothetical protein
MPDDFTSIIADYRKRCANQLQEAAPGTAKQSAYSQMLRVVELS